MKDRLYPLLLALCVVVAIDAVVNMTPLGPGRASGGGVVNNPAAVVFHAGLEYGPDAFTWGDGESPYADPHPTDPVTSIDWEIHGGAYS